MKCVGKEEDAHRKFKNISDNFDFIRYQFLFLNKAIQDILKRDARPTDVVSSKKW